MKVEGYVCPNCGAMLEISKTYKGICTCQHCGGEYRITDEYAIEPLKVEVCQVPLITLGCNQIISDHDLYICDRYGKKEEFIEHNLKSLARSLSEQIVPYMDAYVDRDMRTMNYSISGRVRIASPTGTPLNGVIERYRNSGTLV